MSNSAGTEGQRSKWVVWAVFAVLAVIEVVLLYKLVVVQDVSAGLIAAICVVAILLLLTDRVEYLESIALGKEGFRVVQQLNTTIRVQQQWIENIVKYSLSEVIYRDLLWKIGNNKEVIYEQTPDQERWLQLLFDHGMLEAKDKEYYKNWKPFKELEGKNLSEVFAPTPAAVSIMNLRGEPARA
jgi:hypothetical protein